MSGERYKYVCQSCGADAGHAAGATTCKRVVTRNGQNVVCGGTLKKERY